MLESDQEPFLNSFCFGLRPNNLGELIPEFSRYLFRSPQYRKLVFPLAQGSTRYNLSKTSFKKLILSIPHPDEQQKIAAALSAIDAKIDAVASQLDRLEDFRTGLLQQMFA